MESDPRQIQAVWDMIRVMIPVAAIMFTMAMILKFAGRSSTPEEPDTKPEKKPPLTFQEQVAKARKKPSKRNVQKDLEKWRARK